MRALAATLLALALALAGYGVSIVPSAAVAPEFLVARIWFIGAAVMIVAAYVLWLVDNRRRAISGIGAPIVLGFTTAIALLISTWLAFSWVNARQKLLSPEAPPRTATNIYIECQPSGLPSTYPPSGRFNIMYIQGKGLAPSTIGQMFTLDISDKNQRIEWPKGLGGIPFHGYECQVTNYGDSFLLDVSIEFNEQFRETVATQDNPGESGGKVISSRKSMIYIQKIDPASNNSYVFYVTSLNDQFISISFDNTAKARKPNEAVAQDVALLQPASVSARGGEAMFFSPFKVSP